MMLHRPALALLILLGAASASAQTLSNGLITARFGRSGLTSIAVAGTDGSYDFDRDELSVTIDGTQYDSRALGTPQRLAQPNRVGYVWTAGPHKIAAVYELRPNWLFVSKHVSVTTSVGDYRVNQITLFRATMKEPVTGSYVHGSTRADLGLGSYAVALRFGKDRSLVASAQNPFLAIARDGREFSLTYQPDMTWTSSRGAFVSDRGILAPATPDGEPEPASMLAEWRMGPPDSTPGLYRPEISALTSAVRNLMGYRPAEPLNIFVGWCVNDYQIDIGTQAGRAEYKRVIDRAAELGARHVLFAPTNSDLAKREDSTDDWKWENLLWLGLGQKIRRNEWNPAKDAVPSSVQEMLEYAKSKQVSLVAYVYPVLAFSHNPEWLTTRR
ncbi:MAG TPA: hypothetical protein VF159_07915, partial [Gemmatimonadaceae bacterium]